jgi:hypothetical protein
MSLSAGGLAGEILNSIRGKVNNKNMVDTNMSELGHAIARYLCRETEVKYSWIAQIPDTPPTPDPVTSYTTKKITGDFICNPTRMSNPVMHGVILGNQITTGIRKLQIFPAAGWTVPPGKFLCSPPIVLPPYPSSDSSQYWLYGAGVILRYYKMWINPQPLAGTHGPYIGMPGAIMSLVY